MLLESSAINENTLDQDINFYTHTCLRMCKYACRYCQGYYVILIISFSHTGQMNVTVVFGCLITARPQAVAPSAR